MSRPLSPRTSSSGSESFKSFNTGTTYINPRSSMGPQRHDTSERSKRRSGIPPSPPLYVHSHRVQSLDQGSLPEANSHPDEPGSQPTEMPGFSKMSNIEARSGILTHLTKRARVTPRRAQHLHPGTPGQLTTRGLRHPPSPRLMTSQTGGLLKTESRRKVLLNLRSSRLCALPCYSHARSTMR